MYINNHRHLAATGSTAAGFVTTRPRTTLLRGEQHFWEIKLHSCKNLNNQKQMFLIINREDVVTIECCDCKHRQGVNESCEKCGLRFGKVIKFIIRRLSISS